MLELSESRFRMLGTNTFYINLLGQFVAMTTEPDNLKAVQATQFDQFGLGTRRKQTFGELFGEGRFTREHHLLLGLIGCRHFYDRWQEVASFARDAEAELHKETGCGS